ncbi:hypothetical protein OS493_010399 [Desmophyllum pertusum]|uniref:Dynein heavy chain region D6 P-loop domain-containing protein n=1 Tax=Desmophyllum pertusum TaxID=174260 RepID=A0A9X0DC94_9CNID|nr:hypothetical protein OS493_010399 [Desmophyllum pertusum]
MRMFVESEVGDLMEKSLPVFDEVLSGIKHSIPIFVVMPDHSSVNTPFKISPVESIRRIAEAHNVQCQQISVGHGQEEIIDVALATAVRTDTWLVIENLQLASRHWLDQLYNRLSRLRLQAETSSAPSQWRVFLLCEPADHLPVGLLLFSHQLAWDVVQREGPVYQPLDSTDLDLKPPSPPHLRLFLGRTGNKLVISPSQFVPLCLVCVSTTAFSSYAISWERERPAVATLYLHVTY